MYLSGISLLQKNQISFWPTSLVLAVQLTRSKLVRLASRTQDWNTSKYLHPGYHPGNSPNNSKQSVYHIYWQEQLWQHTSYGFGITMVPEDCFWGLRVESKGELLRMGRQKSVLTSHVGAGSCLKESSSCSVLTRLHTSHKTTTTTTTTTSVTISWAPLLWNPPLAQEHIHLTPPWTTQIIHWCFDCVSLDIYAKFATLTLWLLA